MDDNQEDSQSDYINYADRQNLNKSFDVFRAEVKHFWRHKTVSCLTWFAYVFLTITNVVVMVYSATPSWGKTHEIVGQGGQMEGTMKGYYGMWYMCYELLDISSERRRYCILWADAAYIPGNYFGLSNPVCSVVMTYVCTQDSRISSNYFILM